MYLKNWNKIQYTKVHRKAFRIVEKQLLGYNTFRSLFHDFDKIIMLLFINKEKLVEFTENILIIMTRLNQELIIYK